jgi:hypothetical protein
MKNEEANELINNWKKKTNEKNPRDFYDILITERQRYKTAYFILSIVAIAEFIIILNLV